MITKALDLTSWHPTSFTWGTSSKFCWKVQKDKRGFTDLPERKSVCIQTLPLENTTTGHVLKKPIFFHTQGNDYTV